LSVAILPSGERKVFYRDSSQLKIKISTSGRKTILRKDLWGSEWKKEETLPRGTIIRIARSQEEN